MEFYIDKFYDFKQYILNSSEDIFEIILKERENGMDSLRFFLNYIPSEELVKYDFNDKESLKEFRKVCISCNNPIIRMGGCDLREDSFKKGIDYSGIKLSDPYRNIIGQFDVRNHVLTYSPILPFFYSQRDLGKWANESYFTPMTFEEILMYQIENAEEYYVHVSDYRNLQDIIKYGRYQFKKISKDQMIEYATNPCAGQKILNKYLNI